MKLAREREGKNDEILDLCQPVSSTPCQLRALRHKSDKRKKEKKTVDKLSKLMSTARDPSVPGKVQIHSGASAIFPAFIVLSFIFALE